MPKYRDSDWLEEQYVDQKRSTPDIADECGVSTQTICRWLGEHNIETRDRSEARRLAGPDHAPMSSYDGYEEWRVWEPEWRRAVSVKVHRLAAVAWYGFDAVAGSEVHHVNGVRWDNREENLDTLSTAEHMRHHRLQNPPERGEDGRFE